MSVQPIVSVCIPTRNRSVMLRAALNSVLAQSLRDIEVIVSDNCSTDDTAEVVREIAAADPRVRYMPTTENIGLFGNLSRCLTLGSGRYRVVLPDDDLMLADNLERKARFLDDHPGAGLVHSAFRFLDEHSQPVGLPVNWTGMATDTLQPGAQFLRQSISQGGIVCVSSVMLRSSAVAEERFDGDDGPYADLALWARVATHADIGFIPDALSGFRVHGGSASSGFLTVRVRGQRHEITRHHADALLQAHRRFLDRGGLQEDFRTELLDLLVISDQRMRLTILAKKVLTPSGVALVKRAMGWRQGSRLHRKFSLYTAQRQPILLPDAGLVPDAGQ